MSLLGDSNRILYLVESFFLLAWIPFYFSLFLSLRDVAANMCVYETKIVGETKHIKYYDN